MASNLLMRAAVVAAAIGLSGAAVAQTTAPAPSTQRSATTPSTGASGARGAAIKASGAAGSNGQRASVGSKQRHGGQSSINDIGSGTGAGGNGNVAGESGAAKSGGSK
jgi:hypothetical protein